MESRRKKLKEKNSQLRILHPAKLSYGKEEKQTKSQTRGN